MSPYRLDLYVEAERGSLYPCPECGKALAILERHTDAVVRRWQSGLTNARLEGMNGLFQVARSRARGYRNEANFID